MEEIMATRGETSSKARVKAGLKVDFNVLPSMY